MLLTQCLILEKFFCLQIGLKKKSQTFAQLCTIIRWLKFCVITQNLEFFYHKYKIKAIGYFVL